MEYNVTLYASGLLDPGKADMLAITDVSLSMVMEERTGGREAEIPSAIPRVRSQASTIPAMALFRRKFRLTACATTGG